MEPNEVPPVSGMPTNAEKEVNRLKAINAFNGWYGPANVARQRGLPAEPCPWDIWDELVARDLFKADVYRERAIKRGLGDLIPE